MTTRIRPGHCDGLAAKAVEADYAEFAQLEAELGVLEVAQDRAEREVLLRPLLTLAVYLIGKMVPAREYLCGQSQGTRRAKSGGEIGVW